MGFGGCGANCEMLLSPFEIIITENGGVNGHLAGEFSGQAPFSIEPNGSEILPISATFRVPIE